MSSPSPSNKSSGGGGESDRRVLGRLAKSLVLQNYSQVIATISTMATLVYFYFALTGSTLCRRGGGAIEKEREKGGGVGR
jgi:hypothetical protein